MPLFRCFYRQRFQPARFHTVLLLYGALLLASIACSVGHGASVAAQLNNPSELFCGSAGSLRSATMDSPWLPSMWFFSGDCAIATSFTSLLLLAWLGLLWAWAGHCVLARVARKVVVCAKPWRSLVQARAPPCDLHSAYPAA